jgi:hypothetical protein
LRIEYTALRNLAPGHDVESGYELVVFAEAYAPDTNFAQIRNTSLDRSRTEVDLIGHETLINVTTDLIPSSSVPLWEEFFHSVAAGEDFIIDLESDVSEEAENPISVIMESGRYTREKPIPGYVQYRFTVRTV